MGRIVRRLQDAWRALHGRPTEMHVHINVLSPADPEALRRIADAARAGLR